MNKYKVYVYAICKNEEKHIKRWVNSMKEADGIYVLDTGSTDNSVKLLTSLGVNVTINNYENFKFDEARNASLELVPDDADICVCTDIDEILSEGWRKELESIWTEDTDRVRYNMHFTFDEEGNPLSTYFISKIHKKNKYVWTHPIHEVLNYVGEFEEKIITTDKFTIGHYPDRSKDRSQYLTLLENAVKESPEDDRNMHYLGREYMYYKKWNKAIEILKRHLDLPSATWRDERCASMRFISRCYQNLNDYENARKYLDMAISEAPYLRDPYVERALLEYKLENYQEVEKYSLKALQIRNHQKTYINEPFSWDNTIYDLLAISCYHLEKFNYAIYFVDLALDFNPTDERLINNKRIFIEKENS